MKTDKESWTLTQEETGTCYIAEGKTHGIIAGTDIVKAQSLVNKLNAAHRPNVRVNTNDEIWVCWYDHDKSQGCDYVREI